MADLQNNVEWWNANRKNIDIDEGNLSGDGKWVSDSDFDPSKTTLGDNMVPTLKILCITAFCLILIAMALLVVAGGDLHISQTVATKKYTASLMGRRENSETPYADFKMISEDTILKDASAENALFIGYCKPITPT